MILPDTSIWVDHLRQREPGLAQALHDGQVLMHAMIIGELACGNLRDRKRQLRDWRALPKIIESSNEAVISFLEEKRLMGRGIGFVDAHLLCAAVKHGNVQLWTRDRSLKKLAEELSIAYAAGA